MPDLVLSCGRIVILDEEDFEWASQHHKWRAWQKCPGANPIVVSDGPVQDGRRYRRRLLREIANRVNPFLANVHNRVEVTAKNGNNFDARRENLHILVARARVGRPKAKKPKGYVYHKPKTARRKHGTERHPGPPPG